MFENSVFVAIVVIGSILISMTLHEAMHAFTGHWLGDDTAQIEGRLTLNPLRHIDPVFTIALPVVLVLLHLPPFGAAKPVPFNPNKVRGGEFGAALVGLAGPLTNLLLAIAAAGLFRVMAPADSSMAFSILAIFVQVNIGFFVFNMIPFPPLDGSRVLYAFAPEPLQRVMQQIEGLGFAAIAMFMFVLFPLIRPIMYALSNGLLNTLLG